MKFISFLRKYTFGICILAVLFVLIFFLIPAQENHYVHQDLKIISGKIVWVSMGLSFFIVIIFWVFKVCLKEKWKDSLYILVNLMIVAAFAGFFYLKVIFNFGGLLLNRIVVREKIIHDYVYDKMSGDKNWFFLYDTARKEIIRYEHLANRDMLQHCVGPCKVKVNTKVGLFGWEYDPEVQSVSPFNGPVEK